jgi:hypothetical protein
VNTNIAPGLFINPFLLWSRLTFKAGELVMASTQVIAARTQRIALAGVAPTAADHSEMALMGTEKIAAAAESAQAVFGRMLVLHRQFAAVAFKQSLAATAGLLSIAASRNATESVERQARLARETLAGSVAVAAKLSTASAGLARSAIKPVHKRVNGNVRRLGKHR